MAVLPMQLQNCFDNHKILTHKMPAQHTFITSMMYSQMYMRKADCIFEGLDIYCGAQQHL